MKNIIRHIVSFTFIIAVIFLSACNEDDGVPSVSISTVDKMEAFPGDDVTMSGQGFNTVQFVFVGNKQANFQLDGDNLTFQVPESSEFGMNDVTLAMAGDVRVTTELMVLMPPTPVIDTIVPSAAAAGEVVTLNGSSFGDLVSVTVGGMAANIDPASDQSTILFTVPDGLANNTQHVITVTTLGGEISSESIFYVGQNLLLNGDLELGVDDEFDNWSKFNGGDLLTATTTDSYDGRALQAIAVGGDAWRSQFASDLTPTVSGVEYTAFIWIKGKSGTPGDGGNIRFSTNPNALYSGNYDITAEWQQISWTFTANEAETRLVLDVGVVQDAVYFIDNITLVATGQQGGGNLLPNNSFESGLDDWEVLNGAIEITTTQAHTGSNSLMVTPAAGNPWDTQFAANGVSLTFEGTYELSLWAKAAGPDGVMRVSVSQYDGNGADYFYGADIQVTEEWVKYTWTFDVGKDLPSHRVVLDMGVGSQVLFIDDVILQEM